MPLRSLAVAALALAPHARALHARALHARAPQPKWQTIGHTDDGNAVQLDPKSVKRRGAIVDATVRVPFLKPKKMPGGNVTSARTMVSFDCAKETVAIKEYTYYFDEKTNKVFQHQVAKIPGYTPVMGGSMTKVAYDNLCKR